MSLQTRLGALITAIGTDIKAIKASVANAYTVTENWHEVGVTGEPAFANSWTNYNGATNETAGFRKTPQGDVELKGLIKSGTAASVAFTLPAGYRPAKAEHFTVASSGGYGQVQVTTGGAVTIEVAATNNFVSLNGIRFSVSQGAIALSTPTAVTLLPGSPVHGQEVYFQDANMLADGLIWHLRYNANNPTAYKWEFLGGAPLSAEVVPGLTSDETISSATYTNLATAGPVVVTPLSGVYDIEQQASFYGAAGVAAYMSHSTGAGPGIVAAVDNDAAQTAVSNFTNYDVQNLRRIKRRTYAGVQILTSKYRVNAGNGTFRGPRIIRVTPVSVG